MLGRIDGLGLLVEVVDLQLLEQRAHPLGLRHQVDGVQDLAQHDGLALLNTLSVHYALSRKSESCVDGAEQAFVWGDLKLKESKRGFTCEAQANI